MCIHPLANGHDRRVLASTYILLGLASSPTKRSTAGACTRAHITSQDLHIESVSIHGRASGPLCTTISYVSFLKVRSSYYMGEDSLKPCCNASRQGTDFTQNNAYIYCRYPVTASAQQCGPHATVDSQSKTYYGVALMPSAAAGSRPCSKASLAEFLAGLDLAHRFYSGGGK